MSEEQDVKLTWLKDLDLGVGATKSLGNAVIKDQGLQDLNISTLSVMLLEKNDHVIKAFVDGGASRLVVEALVAKLQQVCLHRAGAGAGTSSNAADDTTAAYLEVCLTPLDGNKLRQGTELERLEQPLERLLPLPWEFTYLFNQEAKLRNLLVSVAEEPQAATAYRLLYHVGNVVAFGSCDGSSEVYTAGRTMEVLERTLTLINEKMPGPKLHMNRNTCDTSGATGKRLRPDFMCWVNGALLFKGEEKASAENMEDAIKELGDKISVAWDERLLPGVQAPCMLAYAAAGHLLRFFCIKSSGGGSKPLVQPISSDMDLRLPMGRAKAITATCNVYRLMMGFVGTMPAVLPFALGKTIKSGQSSVTLLPGYVHKTILNFSKEHAAYTTFELLQAVYAAMSKPVHTGCIIQACGLGNDTGPTLRNDKYTVNLTPVGEPVNRAPGTERELAHAVRGALTGLAALHMEGFVHRDVRWSNLIKLPKDQWLLVDLEYAGRDGDDCSQEPYPLRFWSSDTLAPNGTYTTASDLKMLAQQLLSGLPFVLSPEGCDLQQRLSSGAMSAADALQHSWITTRT